MRNQTKYKWPATEVFTHSEFAALNGVKNQVVWAQWATARANGEIEFAGYRKTEGAKGKPSLLFRLNVNYVAPVPAVEVTPATPAEAVAAATPVDGVVPAPVAVVKPKAPAVPKVPPVPPAPKAVKPPKPPKVPKEPKVKAPKVAAAAEPVVTAATPTIVIAGLPAVQPVMPPVAVVNVAPTVEDLKVVVPVAQPLAVVSHTMDVREIAQKCPLCETPLQAMNDATGIMVWCGQTDRDKCPAHESPSGHGRSEQDAYEALCAKFKK